MKYTVKRSRDGTYLSALSPARWSTAPADALRFGSESEALGVATRTVAGEGRFAISQVADVETFYMGHRTTRDPDDVPTPAARGEANGAIARAVETNRVLHRVRHLAGRINAIAEEAEAGGIFLNIGVTTSDETGDRLGPITAGMWVE